MARTTFSDPIKHGKRIRLLTLLDPAQYMIVQDLAKASNTSMTAVVREAINHFFDKTKAHA